MTLVGNNNLNYTSFNQSQDSRQVKKWKYNAVISLVERIVEVAPETRKKLKWSQLKRWTKQNVTGLLDAIVKRSKDRTWVRHTN